MIISKTIQILSLPEKHLFLNIIAGILLGIWLVLVLLGKSGFVHILLISGMAVAVVKIVTDYRGRVTR